MIRATFRIFVLVGLVTPALGVYGQEGTTSVSQAPPQVQSDGARRITPSDVREELDKHKAVLVDVRGEDQYKEGHIKGALSIPWGELLSRLDELPSDKLIVTYCS
jgi:3-mercaptopyruvate sulfurtransferase SseA